MRSYTYLLRFKPTAQVYYGVRYAEKTRNVEVDLWQDYFTSSSIVKNLIEEHGTDAFEFEVRRFFETKEKAIMWEEKVLRRMKVITNSNWLNQNVNGAILTEHAGEYMNAMYHPVHKETHSTAMQRNDVRSKISKANKGKRTGEKNSFYGKTHTEEAKKKIGKASAERKGIPVSEQAKKNIQAAAKDPQRRAKLSKALKGRKFSEETLEKMRIAQQKRQERNRQAKLK